MKKGDRVEINSNAKYEGQEMDWTEAYTGNVTIKKGARLFHSSQKKINSFLTKNTCFCTEGYRSCLDYIYGLIIKEDITVPSFGEDEVRIDLGKYKDKVEIYYIGTGKSKWVTFKPEGDPDYNKNFGRWHCTQNVIKGWENYDKCEYGIPLE